MSVDTYSVHMSCHSRRATKTLALHVSLPSNFSMDIIGQCNQFGEDTNQGEYTKKQVVLAVTHYFIRYDSEPTLPGHRMSGGALPNADQNLQF